MLRQIFKSLIVARQASAAFETLSHLSDHQLQDIGFTRATYVTKSKLKFWLKWMLRMKKKPSKCRQIQIW